MCYCCWFVNVASSAQVQITLNMKFSTYHFFKTVWLKRLLVRYLQRKAHTNREDPTFVELYSMWCVHYINRLNKYMKRRQCHYYSKLCDFAFLHELLDYLGIHSIFTKYDSQELKWYLSTVTNILEIFKWVETQGLA